MFDGLIVNLAIFQDNLTDALVDLSLLLLIKKIEVQICRESRQIVEKHGGSAAFECHYGGKQRVREYVLKQL